MRAARGGRRNAQVRRRSRCPSSRFANCWPSQSRSTPFWPSTPRRFSIHFAAAARSRLEAQRLGLRAYASDLNPVPVLITKALIEIPPKFAGLPPVNPEWQKKSKEQKAATVWQGAQRLGRRRSLLWQVDARRGGKANWPPLSEGQNHQGNGQGTAGLERLRRPGADRHRMAMGTHMFSAQTPPVYPSPPLRGRLVIYARGQTEFGPTLKLETEDFVPWFNAAEHLAPGP